MTHKVAALYQFAALPDYSDLRAPLLELCATHGIRGTLLLSPEGINGTIAGLDEGIDTVIAELTTGALFGGRLDNLELKFSTASAMPFKRLKVRLKKEIVTLAQPQVDPTRQVGTYVAAEDWNALISDPDVIVVDTRNRFEVKMGTFERALDPETRKFSQFPDFVSRTLDPDKNQKIAMFCTGGIRCEKASSYLLSEGFAEVFHLKGGILKYLETIPPEQSLWQGECFVFDERVALGHGLIERALAGDDESEDDAPTSPE